MAKDPLHGLTLETMLQELVAHFGWAELGERIPVKCFTHDPSISSSLKFLRRTPWARTKVEGLYGFMLREKKRASAQESAQDAARSTATDVEGSSTTTPEGSGFEGAAPEGSAFEDAAPEGADEE